MERDPIRMPVKTYGTERRQFSASQRYSLAFGEIDDPIIVDVPKGVRELVLQGRMCGDFYAEAHIGERCRSVVNSNLIDAVKGALAAVEQAS